MRNFLVIWAVLMVGALVLIVNQAWAEPAYCFCPSSQSGVEPTCTQYEDTSREPCDPSCMEATGVCPSPSSGNESAGVSKNTSSSPNVKFNADLQGEFDHLGVTAKEKLNPAGITGSGALAKMFGRVAGFFVAGIGSFSIVFYVWGGFLWMTAMGNSDRVQKAQNVIIWTTLGLVAILSSYIMVSFLFGKIVPAA